MRKIALLAVGLALASAATASAQQSKTAAPRAGYIGVSFRGQSFYVVGPGSENTAEVVVREVSKGSPAEKAGLKAGDEVIRINGMSPANGKFGAVARTLTEGDTVTLRIKRDGKEREYTVIAAARPEGYAGLIGDRTIMITADSVRGLMRDFMGSARIHLDTMHLPRVWMNGDSGNVNIRIERFGTKPGDTLFFGKDTVMLRHFRNGVEAGELFRHFEGELGPGAIFRSMELGSRAIAGAEFTDLDPAMKTYFGTDRGLLTLRVAAETPAARAGLVAGDIIVKANGRSVTRVAELRNALFAQPETVKLEILRKGEPKTLEIQLRRKGTE
jgi:membrane-associated protease RseP (regulator of RpoE activity)